MPALLMLVVTNQITSLLNRLLDPGEQLLRKEGKAERLADKRGLFAVGREEGSVRVYGAGESLGEPVQRDVG
jgi:hypothetical protein